MVDPVWAGVIGGAVGSISTAVVSLCSPRILWSMESKKIALMNEAELAATKREHQRQMVREWRDGLAEARIEAEAYDAGVPHSRIPFLTGRTWFESLRPHLTLPAAKVEQITRLFDQDAFMVELSTEISAIESRWGLV